MIKRMKQFGDLCGLLWDGDDQPCAIWPRSSEDAESVKLRVFMRRMEGETQQTLPLQFVRAITSGEFNLVPNEAIPNIGGFLVLPRYYWDAAAQRLGTSQTSQPATAAPQKLARGQDAEAIARLGAYLFVRQMKSMVSADIEKQMRQGQRMFTGEPSPTTQSKIAKLQRTIYGVHSKVALELGMSDEEFRQIFSSALGEAGKKSDAEISSWCADALPILGVHLPLAEKYYSSDS